MNPMSILTLPTTALREAYLHSEVATSRGKRTERRSAFVVCLVAIVGALVFALA